MWRADLITSVLSLDRLGHVVTPEHAVLEELYPAALAWGSSLQQLTDRHISQLVPALSGRPLTDLFIAGALGQVPATGGARRASVQGMSEKKPAFKSREFEAQRLLGSALGATQVACARIFNTRQSDASFWHCRRAGGPAVRPAADADDDAHGGRP